MENEKGRRSFFVGVWVPDTVQKEVQIAQNAIKEISSAHIRFVDPIRVHLTLQFLGFMDETRIPQVIDALYQIQQKPFTITTGTKLDLFLKRDRAVIYIPLIDSPELAHFVAQLQELLGDLIPLEQRNFHAHVTIARAHQIQKKQSFVEQIRMIPIPQMQLLINSFELIESIRTEHGSSYVTIASCMLR